MVSILWLIEAKNKYLFLLLALPINQSLLKMNMNNKQYILPFTYSQQAKPKEYLQLHDLSLI